MTEFLKKYWWVLLIIVIAGIVIAYQQIQLHEKNSQIYYRDSVIALDSQRYKTLAEQYVNEKDARADIERQNKSLSDIVDKSNEQIRTYIQVIAKLKKQTYTYVDTVKVFKVINDTILVPVGEDKIDVNIENSLYKVYGQTHLYPKKGYELTFEGKPITLDVVVTEDKNGVYNSYLDVNNSDLELVSFKTRFLKEQETFWKGFYSQTSLSITNKNVLFDLGLGYNHWGIKGILGLDYQDYTISRNNVIFGAGITYKLF